jgi:LPS sulfotransferase NodH
MRLRQTILPAIIALLSGCGEKSVSGDDVTTTLAALNIPARSKVARERVLRQAPSWKRATQAEVNAFQARANGGVAPRQHSKAELDAIVAEASSPDPERRRNAVRQFHVAIRSAPSLESRKALGERFLKALGAAK